MKTIKLEVKNNNHINEFILFLIENGSKVWRTSFKRGYETIHFIHFEIIKKEENEK